MKPTITILILFSLASLAAQDKPLVNQPVGPYIAPHVVEWVDGNGKVVKRQDQNGKEIPLNPPENPNRVLEWIGSPNTTAWDWKGNVGKGEHRLNGVYEIGLRADGVVVWRSIHKPTENHEESK